MVRIGDHELTAREWDRAGMPEGPEREATLRAYWERVSQLDRYVCQSPVPNEESAQRALSAGRPDLAEYLRARERERHNAALARMLRD